MKFLLSSCLLANNFIVELLEEEGAEAVCPDLIDFFMYSLYNANFKAEYLGKKKSSAKINNFLIWFIEKYRKCANDALAASKRFHPTVPIQKLAEYAHLSYPAAIRQVRAGSSQVK